MASKPKKESQETGIPPLVEDCIKEIRLRGLHEDGILRVSGSAAQIKDLQNAYRKGKRLDLSNVYIHTVGGVLKNYFRDMPKPILTFEAYDDFLAVAALESDEEKIIRLRFLISQLPIENQELLHKTIIFITEVSKYSEENQMHLANLATMFGPTFLRKKEQERAALLHDLQDVIAVTHTMLMHNMFENWPDDQDRHPSRMVVPNKDAAKKVKQAVASWYGSPNWEKEVKKRQSTRSHIHVGGSRNSSNVALVLSQSTASDGDLYPEIHDKEDAEMYQDSGKNEVRTDDEDKQSGKNEESDKQSGKNQESDKQLGKNEESDKHEESDKDIQFHEKLERTESLDASNGNEEEEFDLN